MRRSGVGSQILSIMTGNALQALCNLAAAFLATKFLAPSERGIMVTALTVSTIVGLVFTVGLGVAFRTLLPHERGRETRLKATFSWSALLGALAAALATPAAVGLVLPDADVTLGLQLVIAVHAASIVLWSHVVDSWYAGAKFGVGSVWAALGSTVGLAGLVVGMVLVDRSAVAALGGQSLASAIAVTAFIAVSTRHGRLSWVRPTSSHFLQLLRLGVPALVHSSGMVMAYRLDRIILAVVLGPTFVAVYALAAAIAEALRLFPMAIGQHILAVVSRSQDVRIVRAWIFRSMVATAGLSLLLVLAAQMLVVPIFGDAYTEVPLILGFLAVGEIAFSAFSVATKGLQAFRHFKETAWVGTWVGVAAGPAYWIGTETMGMVGCAVASLLLYFAAAVAAVGLLKRTGSTLTGVPEGSRSA